MPETDRILTRVISCQEASTVDREDWSAETWASFLAKDGNVQMATDVYLAIIADKAASETTFWNLSQLKKGNDSLQVLKLGLHEFPCSALLNAGIGVTMIQLREFQDVTLVRAYLDRALHFTCDPKLVSPIWMNLALLESHLGHLDKAMQLLLRAIKAFPGNHLPWLNLGVEILYSPGPSEFASKVLRSLFGREFVGPRPIASVHKAITNILYHNTQRNHPITYQGGPVRVGYIGGDFFDHPVANFTRHLLMSKNSKIQNFIYSTSSASPHRYTDEIPLCVYRSVRNLSTTEASKLISDDNISVLIDLAGFTKGGRLDVFASRPAPHLLSYCGYPCNLEFPNAARVSDHYTEQFTSAPIRKGSTIRLPRLFLAYSTLQQQFPVRKTRDDGLVVFGCFAKLQKINKAVTTVWKKLLERMPCAVLVLKGMQFLDPTIKN